eukprot:gene5623-6197_t
MPQLRSLLESFRFPDYFHRGGLKYSGEVTRRIGAGTLDICQNYVRNRLTSLWGEEQPQSILEDMIFLVFYGDLYHLFFDTILEEANSAYHVGRHPLENNFHNIRKRPVEWVDTVIQTGTVADWQRMSKEANRLRTPTSEWTQQTFASLANSLPL